MPMATANKSTKTPTPLKSDANPGVNPGGALFPFRPGLLSDPCFPPTQKKNVDQASKVVQNLNGLSHFEPAETPV